MRTQKRRLVVCGHRPLDLFSKIILEREAIGDAHILLSYYETGGIAIMFYATLLSRDSDCNLQGILDLSVHSHVHAIFACNTCTCIVCV